MLAAITAFLGAIPAMISMISSLITFIKEEETAAAQKALANKVAAGIQTATQTGNTSALENIFKSGS
jgi:hypothetical protein